MESNLNPIAGNNFQQRDEEIRITATAATIVVTEEKDKVMLNPAAVTISPEQKNLAECIELPVGDVREGQLPPALEAELMKRATEHGRANKDSQGRMQ